MSKDKINDLLNRYPNVRKEELYEFFPKLDYSNRTNLCGYTWEEWHEGSLGAGDLYLADEMANLLELKPGNRVIELGAGRCLSSIFLAKHYGVNIIAADWGINPSDNWKSVIEKGVEDKVLPIKCDVRNLPFPENYFDAIFSMNAYCYFGTDDLFLPYLLEYLKTGGKICISSPCYSKEIDESTPEYLLFDSPNYLESYCFHSPTWWANHFTKVKTVELLYCKEHSQGREIWLDSVRWQLETTEDKKSWPAEAVPLLKDRNRFITYFTLLARKTGGLQYNMYRALHRT